MRKLLLLLCLLAWPCHGAPADYVNPLIGTDNSRLISHGNTYPAAAMPFGMLQWTPQTAGGVGLYQYSQTRLSGFRATHKPSLWMDDYGCLSLMPVRGPLHLGSTWSSAFSHDNESAHPYEYRCHLDDAHADVSIIPSERGGLLSFAFDPSDPHPGWLILDAQGGGSGVELRPAAQEIVGYNAGSQVGPHYRCWFVMHFDTPWSRCGTWDGAGLYDGSLHREGDHVGAYIACGSSVRVRVATSFISIEQAERNLAAEMPDFDALAARTRAWQRWNDMLGRVTVEGATDSQLTTFYTAMYRCLLFPHELYEMGPDGPQYFSPYDLKLHSGYMYADCGFWDTYRTEFPWLCLMYPERASEICQAMLNIYDQSGWLPKWPNPTETNVMIATHADAALAQACVTHVPGLDVHKAWQAARRDSTRQGDENSSAREGLEYYRTLGYLPADRMQEATSRTLEFAYDDFCVAQLARAAGQPADDLLRQAANYRNVFDTKSQFMRGRNLDGSWVEPFDPLAWGSPFTEGSAWHYEFSVPQDMAGLVALFGGPGPFARKLDQLLSTPPRYRVGSYHRVIHEMRELPLAHMGQYAANNEPVQAFLYLFDYAGQPWKSQYWVRQACATLYTDKPDGILGDEDTGQMSAWYVMSALGFYPACPGQPIYTMGSPLFPRAVLHWPNGRSFSIEADGNRADHPYIESATLNGQALDRPWFTHDAVAAGGDLHLVMAAKANRAWGSSPTAAPPSALETR